MRLSTRLPFAVVMAASVVWSRGALADDEDPYAEEPAVDAARSRAEAAFARGERARRAGRWRDAEASYRAAYEVDPRPEVAGELGLSELALGRFRDAAEHLHESLRDPARLAPARRRRYAEGLDRAEREVSLTSIAVSPPRAEVFIDGRRIGQGQGFYLVYVDPGRHEAYAKLEGYIDDVYPFEARRGEDAMVGLHLERRQPAPAAVVVHAPAPVAPAAVAAVPPADAAVPAGASGPAAGTVFRIGGLALASAGVALGTGFAIAAAARGEEAAAQAEEIRWRGGGGPAGCHAPEVEHAASCRAMDETKRARDTLEAAAWASFLSAGVVGAVALSSFWWAPAPGRSAVRVVPLATAVGGGVLLTGAW